MAVELEIESVDIMYLLKGGYYKPVVTDGILSWVSSDEDLPPLSSVDLVSLLGDNVVSKSELESKLNNLNKYALADNVYTKDYIDNDFTEDITSHINEEVTSIQNALDSAVSDLQTDIDSKVAKDSIYTKDEIDTKLNNLDKYALSDDIDVALLDKADKNDVYTKDEADTKHSTLATNLGNEIDTKANKQDVYTKAETDTAISTTASNLSQGLGSAITNLSNTKAEKSDVYTKSETDTAISNSASAVSQSLGSTISGISNTLNTKQDKIDDLENIRNNASLGATAVQKIPIASSKILGGVKIGEGISVSEDGTISADVTVPEEIYTTINLYTTLGTSNTVGNNSDRMIVYSLVPCYDDGTPVDFESPDVTKLQTVEDYDVTAITNKRIKVKLHGIGYSDIEDFNILDVYVSDEFTTITASYEISQVMSNMVMTNTIMLYIQIAFMEDSCVTLIDPSSSNYSIQVKEYSDDEESMPIASSDTLGGVKVGDGLNISSDGVLSVPATEVVIPLASSTAVGGIKVSEDSEALFLNNKGFLQIKSISIQMQLRSKSIPGLNLTEVLSNNNVTIYENSAPIQIGSIADSIKSYKFHTSAIVGDYVINDVTYDLILPVAISNTNGKIYVDGSSYVKYDDNSVGLIIIKGSCEEALLSQATIDLTLFKFKSNTSEEGMSKDGIQSYIDEKLGVIENGTY